MSWHCPSFINSKSFYDQYNLYVHQGTIVSEDTPRYLIIPLYFDRASTHAFKYPATPVDNPRIITRVDSEDGVIDYRLKPTKVGDQVRHIPLSYQFDYPLQIYQNPSSYSINLFYSSQ